MAAVVPASPGLHIDQRPTRKSVRVLQAVGKWVRRVAGRLPGEYTIAKLDAFGHFQRQPSSARVVAILLLTPVPCFLTSLLLESIPLADPAAGFRGSLNFQIRNFLTATIMTAMPVFMKLDCVPQLVASWKFVTGYSLLTAAVGIANNAVIALAADVFPVPFTQFAPAIPMAFIGVLLNRLISQQSTVKKRVERIDRGLAMDMMPVFVYPVFTAAFMAVRPGQQMWLSLLLPVIKLLLRYVIWLTVREDLDLIGPTTSSVGHLYHVLFTATCLQNAKSLETLAAVVVVNLLQMLLHCRDILKDARALRRAEAQLDGLTIHPAGDVISRTLKRVQQEQIATCLHTKSPSRIFSTYPGYQNEAFLAQYESLLPPDERRSQANQTVISAAEFFRLQSSRRRSLLRAQSPPKQPTTAFQHKFSPYRPLAGKPVAIVPLAACESELPSPSETVDSIEPRTDRGRHGELCVRSATSALHQTEMILLRSYITIFMLTFYGLYLILVLSLHNREYFATMSTVDNFAAVGNTIFHLLLIGSMELIFLAVYCLLISHELGVSGVKQLAFILWSQRTLVQSKCLALSIMILGFPLEHYGNGIIYKLRTG